MKIDDCNNCPRLLAAQYRRAFAENRLEEAKIRNDKLNGYLDRAMALGDDAVADLREWQDIAGKSAYKAGVNYALVTKAGSIYFALGGVTATALATFTNLF